MNQKKFFKNIEAKLKPSAVVILLIIACVSTIFFMTGVFVDTAQGAYADYTYSKQITLASSFVDTSLTNFPILVYDNTGDLLGSVLSNGSDIAFYDSAQTTQLNHEIERYDATTGELVAWVRIPLLDASVDTVIYMCYDDSDGGYGIGYNPTEVWDDDFQAVYHMNVTSGNVTDATSNGLNSIGIFNTPIYEQTGIAGDSIFLYGNDVATTDSEGFILPAALLSNPEAEAGYTLEGWTFLDAGARSYRYMLYLYDEVDILLAVRDDTGEKAVCLTNDDGSVADFLYGTNIITTGHWIYLATTYDGSDKFIYENASDKQTSSEASIKSTGSENRIGGTVSDKAGVNGDVDEIRISKTCRNDTWIEVTFASISQASGFLTLGSEDTTAPSSSYALNGLTDDMITFSGMAGNIVWCNSSGEGFEYPEINLSMNTTDNVTGVIIYLDDCNDTLAYINASNFTLYVSSDNSSYGSLGSFTDGGSNISINTTIWNAGTMGANPFLGAGIINKDDSIWFKVACSLPSSTPTDVFYSSTLTSCKIYIGYYT